MKRWFSLSLALLMLFCFSAAYAQSEQFSWPAYESIVNMPASAITSIQFSFSTEAGVQEATITDAKTIEGVCALIQVFHLVPLSLRGDRNAALEIQRLRPVRGVDRDGQTVIQNAHIAFSSDGKHLNQRTDSLDGL